MGCSRSCCLSSQLPCPPPRANTRPPHRCPSRLCSQKQPRRPCLRLRRLSWQPTRPCHPPRHRHRPPPPIPSLRSPWTHPPLLSLPPRLLLPRSRRVQRHLYRPPRLACPLPPPPAPSRRATRPRPSPPLPTHPPAQLRRAPRQPRLRPLRARPVGCLPGPSASPSRAALSSSSRCPSYSRWLT